MTTVWFNNLPNDCSQDDFKAFAAKAGAISGDIEFGRNSRMAWVTYANEKAAEKAIAMNGQDFGGRDVQAQAATREKDAPKKERAPRAPAAAPTGPVTYFDDRVLVKGLPTALGKEAVSSLFAKAGTVVKVLTVSPGVMSVSYETASSASAAVAMNGKSINIEGTSVALSVEFEARRKPARVPGSAPAPRAPRAPREPAASRAPAGPAEAVRVAVKAFPAGTTGDELKSLFASCGRIATTRILKDGSTALIGFEEASAGPKALLKDGATFKGTPLAVSMADRQPGAPREAGAGRKRTSGEEEEEGGAPAPRRERAPADLSAIVWVGNLAGGATEDDVRRIFSAFGPIADKSKAIIVNQVKDAAYGFVTFADASAQAKAVAANGRDGLRIEAASSKPTAGRKFGRRPRATA